ncbi:ribbon-helix-helix domain-containing protein [Erythrobacter mangrovi]|uniref:Ribbon-helix-helix domain-containing protein n=1 Tax=Erythrobacter mangrovi TaxID=2739433 RepID=A0A7D3XHU6_9SPHN|nr:ribbon-helix-helix domain-containing protein [Erythrobacter mangrovi]QKG70779.1 ribbon-helix-helix domain-containing protein [Erythrobacter mangrovi]
MIPPYHPPRKYSVRIAGHRTSISLEPMFWDMLTDAAASRNVSINTLVADIDAERIKAENPPGLAGAIRIWLVWNDKGRRTASFTLPSYTRPAQ